VDTAGTVPTFEDLVGDADVFFAKHFGNRPLLRRSALAGRVRDLMSVRQFDDIVSLEAVSPAYLRVAKDGRGVPSKAYTRTVAERGAALTEAVVPEQVYELFRSGGTVAWSSLGHFLPSARHLMAVFTDVFGCPCEIVAFLTPAGRDGYAPHHDPVDVYVIQVEGTKDWRIWDPPDIRKGDSVSYALEDLGPPAMETTLCPGDVLYLPYNTPHAAAAKAEVSLHLSVTVEPRRWRDLLADMVAALLTDERFHAFPHVGRSPAPATAARLGGLLESLRERIAGVDAVEELTRLAAESRARHGVGRSREFERLATMDDLEPGARLRRSGVPLQIGASDGTKTDLVVNGHRLAVPDALADVLRELEGGGVVTAAEFFPGASGIRSLRAAQGLARLGVLETVDSTRS
jgi:ribosomal protein L16 Arg81 hydroxylase